MKRQHTSRAWIFPLYMYMYMYFSFMQKTSINRKQQTLVKYFKMSSLLRMLNRGRFSVIRIDTATNNNIWQDPPITLSHILEQMWMNNWETPAVPFKNYEKQVNTTCGIFGHKFQSQPVTRTVYMSLKTLLTTFVYRLQVTFKCSVTETKMFIYLSMQFSGKMPA